MFKLLRWRNNNGVELETVIEDSKLGKIIDKLEEKGYPYKETEFSS
jgi:hypothetical protein